MTEPNLLPGSKFRAYRVPTTGAAQFVCLASSITLTLTNAFEDATVSDCDDPDAVPYRKSVLASRSWGGRIAGQIAADHLDDLRADNDSETPVPYEFRIAETGANGGGKWTGPIFVESLEIGRANRGIVSFTAQFRGDGALVWSNAT